MWRFLRRLFDLIFWWIVVIVCVGVIGYFLWPLFSDKFYSLCSNNSEFRWCRGDWGSETSADRFQDSIEARAGAFTDLSKTAASDVLTDRGGKTKVTYSQDESGIYIPSKSREGTVKGEQ